MTARAYNGVWGLNSQWGPWGRAPGQWLGDDALPPPEAVSVLAIVQNFHLNISCFFNICIVFTCCIRFVTYMLQRGMWEYWPLHIAGKGHGRISPRLGSANAD